MNVTVTVCTGDAGDVGDQGLMGLPGLNGAPGSPGVSGVIFFRGARGPQRMNGGRKAIQNLINKQKNGKLKDIDMKGIAFKRMNISDMKINGMKLKSADLTQYMKIQVKSSEFQEHSSNEKLRYVQQMI